MLTHRLSLTMFVSELGYNGPLGTCRRCHQPGKQLRGGICKACEQAAERDRPARPPRVRRCLCGVVLRARQRVCDGCAEARRQDRRDAQRQMAERIRKDARRQKDTARSLRYQRKPGVRAKKNEWRREYYRRTGR